MPPRTLPAAARSGARNSTMATTTARKVTAKPASCAASRGSPAAFAAAGRGPYWRQRWFDHEVEPVQQAPEDEGVARPVPDPGEHHGGDRREGEHVQEGERVAVAGAQHRQAPRRPRPGQRQRHRVVDVGGEEAGEGDVPAQPEVDDARRLERRVEVDRQPHPEEQRRPAGHVGIAREVEVDLQGEADRRQPRLQQGRLGAGGGIGEDRGDVRGHAVGEHHLLEQPEAEEGDADRDRGSGRSGRWRAGTAGMVSP